MSSAVVIGEPAVFAIGLTWYPCPELGDLANTHTWCEFVLWCDGEAVTRHSARGNVYDGLVVPAAPIAAWVGESWIALTSEERLVDGRRATSFHGLVAELDDEEWDDRFSSIDAFITGHALYRSHGGLLLPNVVFWRRGDVVDVSWRPSLEGSGERVVEFTATGRARLPAAGFFDVLRRFVRIVDERARRAPENSFLRGEVEEAERRTTALDDPELLAARVGRDPDAFRRWLEPRTRQQQPVDALAEAYGPEIRNAVVPEGIDSPLARAARSASPAFSEADHEALLALGQQLRQRPVAARLNDLRARVGDSPQIAPGVLEDYELGYARAELVRRVSRNVRGRFEVEELLRRGGCEIRDVVFSDFDTDGVALWTTAGQALIAANTSSPKTSSEWGRRAMLAHELYHLIFDASSHQFFGECTNEWTPTPTERQANAFAAELLLPAEKLRGLPTSSSLDEWRPKIRELLELYGTGWELTVRHLKNRRKIGRTLEAALLDDRSR